MRTPDHDESRSSKARALAVESLEGRRLPSGMGPAPVGPGDSPGRFVYTVDDFGGPHGPALSPPREFSSAPMPGHFDAMRMPMGGFLMAGDPFRTPGPPERATFTRQVQFGGADDNLFRLGSRPGGDGGPVQVRFSAMPVVMSPGFRVDAMFVSPSPIRARAAVDENVETVVFARAQRVTPSAPDAPPLTEAPSAPGSGALPIAAAPEAVAAQPPKMAPAVVAVAARGAGGSIEMQDRRAVAIADHADPGSWAFHPSASGETTSAAVLLLPTGESVAFRPNEQPMPATRSTSRRVAYGGEDIAPEGAELLTHFLPLDRATLEVAIDRVFGQLASISPELPELASPIDWASAVTSLLAAGIAADLAVRALNRYRRDDGESGDDEAGYVLFPGLPGGWKLEER